jgi:Domain of unknown function (DUF5658)
MITDVSRGIRDHSQLAGGATQSAPRVAREAVRPFVVSHASPPLPARRAPHGSAQVLKLAILLAIFALLNAGDLVSTYAGLRSGMHEGNPLMSGLLGSYGFDGLIGYKVVVILAVSVGVFVLRTFSKGIASATIWVCNALVAVVVILNVTQFLGR